MTDDVEMLRAYVRVMLEGEGWEDPDVVYARARRDPDDDEEAPEPDEEASSGSKYRLNKSAEQNLNLHQRGSQSRDNKSMASMKPIAPSNQGGPQSGRSMPGGKTVGVRSYNPGY